MASDSVEIMHITVIERTISQIYCVYKDMDVKMAVIFMNRKDNLVLRICKNFTNFLGNMICLKRCNIVFIIRIKGKNLWLCESTERDRSSGTCSYWRCDPWKCGRYRYGYCSNKKCRIRQKSPEIQLTYLRKKETERASKKKIFSLFFVRKIP